MGKAGRKGGKRLNKKELVEMLTGLFQRNPATEFNTKQIFSEFHLNTHPAKMLCLDVLDELVLDEFIREVGRGRFRFCDLEQTMEGIYQRKANGRNLFVPDDGSEPVLIAERNSAHAMDGDRVRVCLFARCKRGVKEGQVIDIIKRANDTVVGTLKVNKNYAVLLTESRTMTNDIIIPKNKLKAGNTGEKVVVKVTEWPDDYATAVGQVVDVLGPAGDNNTEMHAILAEYGLPYRYPEAVVKAAEEIPAEIPAEEIARRVDCRQVTTFTIDPADAKDFDDALSIRPLKENLWEVGVHIADVTHYVREGSIIDKEAMRRATSVYLVDRTVPMLPERLCNELCSLRPDEDKLAYSVIFHINDKGEVKNHRVAHTVIRSDRRFTYEEAQAILEGGEGPYSEELHTLDRLAKRLREKRFANGAIDFDHVEVCFRLDEQGKPLGVYFKEAKDANRLIEEFMLLANRTVSEDIGKVPKNRKPKVFVYRIHDLPDPEKLENLKEFILKFGYKLRTTGDKGEVNKSFNKLLADVRGKAEQNLIETVSIRTMQKAKYSTHNIGHYGLAFDYYTHFTSPIRRYPDMMAHRLLTRYQEGGRSVTESKYESLCEHSSSMEQLAASAERSSVKYKQVEFMQEHVGQVFDGVISGVTEWGIYVELNENKCEGMISMHDLDNDYYVFDERNYCLVGRRTRKRYSLGDPIQVKVARANLEKKQLDFVLATDSRNDFSEAAKTKGHKEKGRKRRK